MFIIRVYSLMSDVVVELATPAAVDDPTALLREPLVLARHQAALWDDCVDAQVGNIICELLEEAPNYGTQVRDLVL